jgi:hypothetical protein
MVSGIPLFRNKPASRMRRRSSSSVVRYACGTQLLVSRDVGQVNLLPSPQMQIYLE